MQKPSIAQAVFEKIVGSSWDLLTPDEQDLRLKLAEATIEEHTRRRSNMGLNYVMLTGQECASSISCFGIRIEVASTRLPDLKQDSIDEVAYRAVQNIQEAILAAEFAADPEVIAASEAERAALLGLFPDPIFVEEIPNQYSNSYYYKLRPWFIVTTKLGRFKVGSRKRVLVIDWEETKGTKRAEQLFAEEQTTKDDKSIHAWGIKKAAEYVKVIFDDACNTELEEAIKRGNAAHEAV